MSGVSSSFNPKSSSINLYDPFNDDQLFQTKVNADRVDLQVSDGSDLSLHLKGKQVNITNATGQSITDVVQRILATKKSVADETVARLSEVAIQRNVRKSIYTKTQNDIQAISLERITTIADHKTHREGEEGNLTGLINKETAERESAIILEKQNRQVDDTSLQNLLTDEINDRTTKQDALDDQIDTEIATVTAQAGQRAQALTNTVASLEVKIATEESDTTNADTALQTMISDDRDAFQVLLSDQSTSRLDSDDNLRAIIDTKIANLQSKITDERVRITALLEGSSIDLDTFVQLVADYQSEDAALLTQIDTLDQNLSDAQTQFAENDDILQTLLINKDPKITLLGAGDITIDVNSSYTELGATATDYEGNSLTTDIVTSGVVINTTLGTYNISYTVTDIKLDRTVSITRAVNVVPSREPTIALVDATTIVIDVNSTYIEPGATAFDYMGFDITSDIVITGVVNNTILGTYNISYTVTDTKLGRTVSITRVVNVVPSRNPTIALVGGATIDIDVSSIYTELGATAFDYTGLDLTANIVTSGVVNNTILGTYNISYTVTDINLGRTVSVTRAVNVVPSREPTIALVGATTIDIDVNNTYTELGATAFDYTGLSLTANIATTGVVNNTILGTYNISYTVTDSKLGRTVSVTRAVNVVPSREPTIALVGATTIDMDVNSSYTELGATAFDYTGLDLTANIATSGVVYTSTLGTYNISYTVTDSNLGRTVSVTRAVNVVSSRDPTITLVGERTIEIKKNGTYTDLGATALDYLGVSLTADIVTTGVVYTSTLGTYSISYTVTDNNLNRTVSVTRVVTVVAPVLQELITWDNRMTIQKNDLMVRSHKHLGNEPYMIFDMVHGIAPGGPTHGLGWWSRSQGGMTMKDGSFHPGHYAAGDLTTQLQSRVVKAFQVFSSAYHHPVHFLIVGTDDISKNFGRGFWDILYDSAGTYKLTNRSVDPNWPGGHNDRPYSDVIHIPNSTYYTHYGILIKSVQAYDGYVTTGRYDDVTIQELKLFVES